MGRRQNGRNIPDLRWVSVRIWDFMGMGSQWGIRGDLRGCQAYSSGLETVRKGKQDLIAQVSGSVLAPQEPPPPGAPLRWQEVMPEAQLPPRVFRHCPATPLTPGDLPTWGLQHFHFPQVPSPCPCPGEHLACTFAKNRMQTLRKGQ